RSTVRVSKAGSPTRADVGVPDAGTPGLWHGPGLGQNGGMTELTAEQARKRFDELRHHHGRVDPRDLDEGWAARDTVRVEDIRGEWRGSDFDTGPRGSALLREFRWYGKRLNSALDVQPLICLDENGDQYSNTAAAGGGEASLWMVEFRGEVTATMV